MATIIDRIECALQKIAFRQMEVRAIYLDPTDDAALTKADTQYWQEKLGTDAIFTPCEYDGHPLRTGSRSVIYSTHGVEITIPKRLSPRTQAAA